MLQIQTKYFGATECQPDSVFEFPQGLPGFEGERRFVFLEQPDKDPLLFMQSLSNPALCFVLLPVLVAAPDYRIRLGQEELTCLRLPSGREPRIGTDILCAGVVCAGDEARPSPTVNLLAPIVVNLGQRVGMQVIPMESEYSHQHPLLCAEDTASC